MTCMSLPYAEAISRVRRCGGRGRTAGAVLRVLAAPAAGGVPVDHRLPRVWGRARRARGRRVFRAGKRRVHLYGMRTGGARAGAAPVPSGARLSPRAATDAARGGHGTGGGRGEAPGGRERG